MIERLERHFSRFAIPGLIRYVVALNALVFILIKLCPEYAQVLELDPAALRRGEVWRLVSWIFLPQTQDFFWIIFYLMFTWWLGDLLEQSWGVFRLNAYYFLGMALCIASAFLFGASDGNLFLNLSLFLAVATLAPNLEILLFFILPVKLKWVAIVSLVFPAGVLLLGSMGQKMAVVMCLGNYLAFFAPAYYRGVSARQRVRGRRARFDSAKLADSETLHRCAICGATELSFPDADFRVAADGLEYCGSHLPGRKKQG
ncbi:MAG: hypothetical protein WCS65_09380 [Verrucomicrobiae bacterium]